MKELAAQLDMLFVYDASLPVDQPASATVEPGLNLRQNLRMIFRGTGITWAVRRNYVVLTAERQLGMTDSPHTEMLVLSQYDTLSAAFKIDTLPPSVKTECHGCSLHGWAQRSLRGRNDRFECPPEG